MDKRDVRKLNKTFMNDLAEQAGCENILPYVILDDSVELEINGLIFAYSDDPVNNKPINVKVRNDGRELYFIFHNTLSESDYKDFERLAVPQLAKEFLTTDLTVNPL